MGKLKELVEEYDQIVLYRHVNPDLDAFGSQFGFYWLLKEMYPQKNIILEGNMESDLMKYYPAFEISSFEHKKTLGIVLDTANHERIDGDLSCCDKVLKIDHHIVVDSYGDENIERDDASSCSEIVALLLKEEGIAIPEVAAKALYLGIVGDSNRFLYSSTSMKTFEAASYLLESGIDIEKLYQQLYLRKKVDLEVTKYIYNNYEEDGNIAWYYLSSEALKQLHISREQGSNYVNTLANIEEYKIWMAVTQNDKDNNYRVSIRSRGIAINDIANEFRGGGHAFASGATLESLDELEKLKARLKERVYE